MPHLFYNNRYWRIATDDFALPALASLFFRVLYTVLMVAVVIVSFSTVKSCKNGWTINLFVFLSITSFVTGAVIEGLIFSLSTQGTLIETEKRAAIGKYITARAFLTFFQFFFAVWGTILLATVSFDQYSFRLLF